MHTNCISVSRLEIRRKERPPNTIIYDFYIDEEYLPGKLRIGQREENMIYADFDLDYMVVDTQEFPQYDRAAVIRRAVCAFLGQEKPQNQFGTNRIVLYRCHCGCDYCGVISFCLSLDDDFVYWKDVGYESDNGDIELRIGDLKFRKEDYEKVFTQYNNEIEKLNRRENSG